MGGQDGTDAAPKKFLQFKISNTTTPQQWKLSTTTKAKPPTDLQCIEATKNLVKGDYVMCLTQQLATTKKIYIQMVSYFGKIAAATMTHGEYVQMCRDAKMAPVTEQWLQAARAANADTLMLAPVKGDDLAVPGKVVAASEAAATPA